jgi:hypothetical protein
MMAKQPVAPPDGETENTDHSAKQLANAICLQVMSALGRPSDFLRITARQVTQTGYRVNVLTGPDVSSARISHSFFVTTDAVGHVTTSAPVIVKQY